MPSPFAFAKALHARSKNDPYYHLLQAFTIVFASPKMENSALRLERLMTFEMRALVSFVLKRIPVGTGEYKV